MSKKIYKFGFIADIKTVTLALKFPCIVSVYWKRGEKTAEIKQRKEIEKGIVTFNEKLEIQCNMSLDSKTQIFEQKKTKFTVVIFSDKGTKQAGQLYVDVAELLNSKSKKLVIDKNLDKCPDKNAKLTLQLTGYMKCEIKEDLVSNKSNGEGLVIPENPSTMQPDFKKKRKQPAVIQGNNQRNQQPQKQKPFKQMRTQNNASSNPNYPPSSTGTTNSSLPITKENIPRVQLIAAQEQNKRLKSELKVLKDLQIENETLKKQYELGQKKQCEYYTTKYEEIKGEFAEMKNKMDKIKQLQKNKEGLEKQLYENKDKMAAILNYAVLNRMNDLAEELTNIYSSNQ